MSLSIVHPGYDLVEGFQKVDAGVPQYNTEIEGDSVSSEHARDSNTPAKVCFKVVAQNFTNMSL